MIVARNPIFTGATPGLEHGISHDDGLKSSRLAGPLLALYRASNAQRRWRVANQLIQAMLRLESGQVWSHTARLVMRVYHGVQIGAYTYGECFDPSLIPPGVVIGRYTSIAKGVRFHNQNHPIDTLTTHPFAYDPRLGMVDHEAIPPGHLEVGSDVWIGRNVITTPGCTRIGHGAVIGAGAVVTKDVPDYAVVVGNPGKIIKMRFPDHVVARLLATQWWNHSAQWLKSHMQELHQPLETTSLLKRLPTPNVFPLHSRTHA